MLLLISTHPLIQPVLSVYECPYILKGTSCILPVKICQVSLFINMWLDSVTVSLFQSKLQWDEQACQHMIDFRECLAGSTDKAWSWVFYVHNVDVCSKFSFSFVQLPDQLNFPRPPLPNIHHSYLPNPSQPFSLFLQFSQCVSCRRRGDSESCVMDWSKKPGQQLVPPFPIHHSYLPNPSQPFSLISPSSLRKWFFQE